MDIDLCKSCGVPIFISLIDRWEGNGVISCAFLPGGRGIFYESDAISNLYNGLEELLGLSIEHIVVESIRREVRAFMEAILSAEISEAWSIFRGKKGAQGKEDDEAESRALREKHKQYNITAITIGRVLGFGDVHLGEGWETGDRNPWRIQVIRNPYSIISYTAEAIGTVEAFEQKDMWGKYEEIGDNSFRISVSPGNHPMGLKERLQATGYDHDSKPGDITYECCPECGVPRDIARYEWHLEEGIIMDPDSGKRMVLIPPTSLGAVLADLEAELGDEIPEAVIEVQRRSMKSILGAENWSRSGWSFKQMIGLRGLGNLTHYKTTEHSLSINLESSCMSLLMVGFVQALAEIAFGVESSSREWTLSEDGDLAILIKI